MENRYAIFDMDGTLVDSMSQWRALGREYLISRGVREGLEEVLVQTVPMTLLESAELFRVSFGLKGTAEEIVAEMDAVMEQHYRTDVELKPGVPAYLERLHEAGVRMCVATATPTALSRLCLERLGILQWFEFVLSCDEVGVGKHDPAVYLEAARRLGAAPEEITVFEDAPYAIRTAKAAGFHVLAVYDEGSAERWERAVEAADGQITDWRTQISD